MFERISSARIVAAARTVAASYAERGRFALGEGEVPGWVVPPPALEQAPMTRLKHNRNPNLTEVLQAME
jgi:hypothetical protein